MDLQDWNEVEEKLKILFNPVKLAIDGFEVTLVLVRTSQFENSILPYINGILKGEWLVNDCEERRRFYRPVSRSIYSKKEKAAMKKLSKRAQKEMNINPDKKYTYYSPYWSSFRSLKSHLIKNNNVIEFKRSEEK